MGVHNGDQFLLMRLNAGDSGAYKEVYDVYGEAMLQVAKRFFNDEDFAKDVVQDVMIKILHRPKTDFDLKCNLGGYLTNTVYHKCIDIKRKRKRELKDENDYKKHKAAEPLYEDFREQLNAEIREEQQRKLEGSMPQLNAKVQEVIRLRVIEKNRWKDVAAIMGMEVQSVKNMYSRACKLLRQRELGKHPPENRNQRAKRR